MGVVCGMSLGWRRRGLINIREKSVGMGQRLGFWRLPHPFCLQPDAPLGMVFAAPGAASILQCFPTQTRPAHTFKSKNNLSKNYKREA